MKYYNTKKKYIIKRYALSNKLDYILNDYEINCYYNNIGYRSRWYKKCKIYIRRSIRFKNKHILNIYMDNSVFFLRKYNTYY